MKISIKVITIILLTACVISANNGDCKQTNLKKTKGTPSRTTFNINNISTFIYNNGDCDIQPTGDSGFEYPKGSGKYAIFESGLVWGAKVNGDIRVGGSTYNQGLLGGAIKEDGTAEDPNTDHVRIYRVRTDWAQADLTKDTEELGLTEAEVRTQYEKDWNEWPAEYGAPYEDVNNDGSYNPATDIPGVPGAAQTLWYVANDFDPNVAAIYGSDPLKVEVQVTVWGYTNNEDLNNTLFQKYKITNKSSDTFENMYFSLWADPDLGYAGDDNVGVDRNLSMAYVYNGFNKDEYYGQSPPAIGYDFVQGPIVSETGSQAIFNGEVVNEFKNLEATSHYHFVCGGDGDGLFVDPNLRDYNGTLQFYNMMLGKHCLVTEKDVINPFTNEVTLFTRDGDPVTKTGWIQSKEDRSCGDGRNVLSTGSISMEPGETQEVVIAKIGAFGENRLDAVTKLKQRDHRVQKIYNNLLNYEPDSKPDMVSSSIDDNNTEFSVTWEKSNSIETFSDNGYEFQGYNVYQLPASMNDITRGTLITTFDKSDGTTSIFENQFDAATGSEISQAVQFGTDSGLEYEFPITKDYLLDDKLIKGKTYYYAVTAYTYNADDSKDIRTTESQIESLSIVYRESEGGVMFENNYATNHSNGNSDTKVTVKITDPDLLTGDEYEISFYEKIFSFKDGEWTINETITEERDSTDTKMVLWQLKNLTADTLVAVDQTTYDGFDHYPIIENEWGQSVYARRIENLPSYEGLSIIVSDIKTELKSLLRYIVTRDGVETEYNPSTYRTPYGIIDYGQMGWSETGKSIDAFGNGTTDNNILQKDYELRFTGEYEDNPDANGVHHIKEGTGSIATIYNARGMNGLEVHPMNPNPGSDASFSVRIPFEIWNVDDNRQVNLVLVDRLQSADANPFYAWNPNNRMYCEILNTPYSEEVQDVENDSELASNLTWNLVFWKTDWETGDIVNISYPNPIQFGVDTFTFSTSSFTDSAEEPLVSKYKLAQNYPNPFNPTTTIEFALPAVKANHASYLTKLTIYDILGRKVKTLLNKELGAGKHKVTFNASNLSTGVYFYRIKAGNFVQVKKMMLIR
ncbi:MAG: T9SS type A sorting domain-containing protein [Melioribacteraceae bacterium]|nr:T9SS type A sorting domain-containing protein [Melioribacteraceae bacterium]